MFGPRSELASVALLCNARIAVVDIILATFVADVEAPTEVTGFANVAIFGHTRVA